LDGQSFSQSWLVELDARPRPAGTRASVPVKIFCRLTHETSNAQKLIETYRLTAFRDKKGVLGVEAFEGERRLTEEELYAPLGFVLAAQQATNQNSSRKPPRR
jgi:hypothetical protein